MHCAGAYWVYGIFKVSIGNSLVRCRKKEREVEIYLDILPLKIGLTSSYAAVRVLKHKHSYEISTIRDVFVGVSKETHLLSPFTNIE